MKDREIYFKLGLLAGSFLLIFLLLAAGEMGARFLGSSAYHGKENFLVHWAQLAEETGVYPPEPGIINRLGFHSREIPVRKGPKTFRIIVLGGSAVYGWRGIETSWVWPLEQRLQKRYPGKDIEVINAGISGGRSMEELSLLSNLVYLAPDLVIVYDGWNDIYGSHYCRDWYQSKARDVAEDNRSGFSNRFNQWLEHHSYLYLSIKKGFYHFRKALKAKKKARQAAEEAEDNKGAAVIPQAGKVLTGDPSAFEKNARTVINGITKIRCEDEVDYRLRPTGEIPDSFSRIYFDNLQAMARLSRAHGAGFIAFLQPSLTAAIAQSAVPAEAEKITRETNAVFYEDWQNAVYQLYPKAQQVFKQLRQSGIPAYDLSALLSGSRALYFTDDVHYKDPEILDQIAGEVEAWLDEERLLPQ